MKIGLVPNVKKEISTLSMKFSPVCGVRFYLNYAKHEFCPRNLYGTF